MEQKSTKNPRCCQKYQANMNQYAQIADQDKYIKQSTLLLLRAIKRFINYDF